jgi:hypothetical protein
MKPLHRNVFVCPQAEAHDDPQELLAVVLAAKPAE